VFSNTCVTRGSIPNPLMKILKKANEEIIGNHCSITKNTSFPAGTVNTMLLLTTHNNNDEAE